LGLPTPEAQVAGLKTIVKRSLSVRQTEDLVRSLLGQSPSKSRPVPSPETVSLEEDFRDSLGTKVNLHRGKKGQGRLVIHFYSDEELQNIYDVIVGGG
jgi:ParB family chromosome partitioning protein